MIIKFLEYDSICQGESDLIRTSVDEIFHGQRVLAPRSLAAYSCKFDLLRKSVEQIRKTPSKFSNITRAEVFWFSTSSPSSVCVMDCAINGFIGDQISLPKGDVLVFKNRKKGIKTTQKC